MNLLVFLAAARLMSATPVSYAGQLFPRAHVSAPFVVENDTVISLQPSVTWDGLTVKKGANLEVKNCQLVTVLGEMDNMGGFYVTPDPGSTLLWATPSKLSNSGVWVFDASKGGEWSSVYIRSTGAFSNLGNIFFQTHGLQYNAPFDLEGDDIVNSGAISIFRRQDEARGEANLYSLLDQPKVTNSGSLCFHNARCVQQASMKGAGCVGLYAGSEYVVQVSAAQYAFQWDPQQTVALYDNSTLVIGGTYGASHTYLFRVVHFGGDATIKFDSKITQADMRYNDQLGYLEFGNLLRARVYIGIGYDPERIIVDEKSLTVRYDGSSPNQEVPFECVCDWKMPVPS